MTEIDKLLEKWPYDPDNSVRFSDLEDGREVMQLRVDQGAFQGILQMFLDGRPDGVRPRGCDFQLDYYENKAAEHTRKNGRNSDFSLSHEECLDLFDESYRVYQRYIFLLQLEDYERVIRDTERNMRLFRFVHRYAETAEDRDSLERWWPYILRIHGEAAALQAVSDNQYEKALRLVRDTRIRIQALDELDAEEFREERLRSYEALDRLEEAIVERCPLSRAERLRKQLEEAVSQEEFEKAAVLRDRLEEIQHRAD